jgi:hypothetical protein
MAGLLTVFASPLGLYGMRVLPMLEQPGEGPAARLPIFLRPAVVLTATEDNYTGCLSGGVLEDLSVRGSRFKWPLLGRVGLGMVIPGQCLEDYGTTDTLTLAPTRDEARRSVERLTGAVLAESIHAGAFPVNTSAALTQLVGCVAAAMATMMVADVSVTECLLPYVFLLLDDPGAHPIVNEVAAAREAGCEALVWVNTGECGKYAPDSIRQQVALQRAVWTLVSSVVVTTPDAALDVAKIYALGVLPEQRLCLMGDPGEFELACEVESTWDKWIRHVYTCTVKQVKPRMVEMARDEDDEGAEEDTADAKVRWLGAEPMPGEHLSLLGELRPPALTDDLREGIAVSETAHKVPLERHTCLRMWAAALSSYYFCDAGDRDDAHLRVSLMLMCMQDFFPNTRDSLAFLAQNAFGTLDMAPHNIDEDDDENEDDDEDDEDEDEGEVVNVPRGRRRWVLDDEDDDDEEDEEEEDDDDEEEEEGVVYVPRGAAQHVLDEDDDEDEEKEVVVNVPRGRKRRALDDDNGPSNAKKAKRTA